MCATVISPEEAAFAKPDAQGARQLDAIAESRGLVGANFATMRRPERSEDARTAIAAVVSHVRYVAIGSHFDGAVIPEGSGDASGLQGLVRALADGSEAEDINEICSCNCLRSLEAAWREAPAGRSTLASTQEIFA